MSTPSFDGATGWLNTEPPGPPGLRGRVVLADFWTFTCINWLRTEPYVRAWTAAYRDDGLVVVGVHTPEFSFEHDVDLVRAAVADHGIDHPVAIDNDYAIWTSFDNHYWPALYLLDADGVVRDSQFGEGRYEETERSIQRLLGVDRPGVSASTVGAGVEAEADWAHLRTPETYLGSARGERFSPSDRAALALNRWTLDGDWTVRREKLLLAGAGGSLAFRFRARDVHLVLSRAAAEPIPFRVLLDGEPPGPSAGVDVTAGGDALLATGRLYQLVRQQGPVRERTVEVTFAAAGAEAYAFTFG